MSHTATKQTPAMQLEPPRLENGRPLLIAGLRKSYLPEARSGIPAQWRSFGPHLGKIAGQIGRATYGVCWLAGDHQSIEYLSGVEVSGFAGLPTDFTVASLPAQRYAVFPHRRHVSELYQTCDAISKWLPESGYQSADADAETPAFFERYSEEFDPRTGMGGMEVWVPIKP